MNLIELIVWIFAVHLAVGAGVHGYRLFGLPGLVGGIILGLVAGIVIGAGIIKLVITVFFSKRSGEPRTGHDDSVPHKR